ncbi:SCP2 sterol-binding domain-containing protein [Jeongeupia wiesaeckerbachi]|uniref:alkyl sulfatase C-terminal domain-containing protein n=1 Tax=Jeongeupia wiesaeckerbachi TaxID=3051218 RepID=UPI003D803B02
MIDSFSVRGLGDAADIDRLGEVMSPDMLFDYLAVRLNPEKAAGKNYAININFTDLKKHYTLTVENAVLNHTTKQAPTADVTLTMTKSALNAVQLKETTLEQAIADGKIKVDGKADVFEDFMTSIDNYNFWFNIVTP